MLFSSSVLLVFSLLFTFYICVIKHSVFIIFLLFYFVYFKHSESTIYVYISAVCMIILVFG